MGAPQYDKNVKQEHINSITIYIKILLDCPVRDNPVPAASTIAPTILKAHYFHHQQYVITITMNHHHHHHRRRHQHHQHHNHHNHDHLVNHSSPAWIIISMAVGQSTSSVYLVSNVTGKIMIDEDDDDDDYCHLNHDDEDENGDYDDVIIVHLYTISTEGGMSSTSVER